MFISDNLSNENKNSCYQHHHFVVEWNDASMFFFPDFCGSNQTAGDLLMAEEDKRTSNQGKIVA